MSASFLPLWFLGAGFLFLASGCRVSSDAEKAWPPIQQAIEQGETAKLWTFLTTSSRLKLEALARKGGFQGTGQALFQTGSLLPLSSLRLDPSRRSVQNGDQAQLFFLDSFGQAIRLSLEKESGVWRLVFPGSLKIAGDEPSAQPSSKPHNDSSPRDPKRRERPTDRFRSPSSPATPRPREGRPRMR